MGGTKEESLKIDAAVDALTGATPEEDPPMSESPVTHVRRGSERPNKDVANDNQRLIDLAVLRGDRTLAEALRARKARDGS